MSPVSGLLTDGFNWGQWTITVHQTRSAVSDAVYAGLRRKVLPIVEAERMFVGRSR